MRVSKLETAAGVFLRRFIIVSVILVSACAGPIQRADEHIAQDEWMKAVLEYRKAVANEPGNIEFKSRLKQTELKAADHYYQRGLTQFDQENIDGAIVQFQQGLAAMSDHSKLLQAMNQALARKESVNLHEDALREREAGKHEDAVRLLKQALEFYPDNKTAKELLARYEIEKLTEEGGDRLMLTSRMPITLNFRQTDIRTAFEFAAKSFGVDVIFDETIKSTPITLFAKDVTFDQAINLMLATTKMFYKKIGPNTILIAPDTREKRGQYEDQIVRTFHLSRVRAKDMAEILKGVINVKKLIVNESQNTIVLRDTQEVLTLAEKMITANDRRTAELIMEVEILEVNRTKAEALGLDLGSYKVTAAIPATTAIPVTGNIREAIRNALTLTLPTATFNFYKRDVDAKTLANPKIRVLSNKTAKIHIGDRVPLRASTIQDVTGQIRTTYDYKDIGIRLNVEPVIHLDNTATVKVALEVSSLGPNLGTEREPAFSIGTRNAETYMLLRDGETAILGGLIRDEDRTTTVRLPGVGDIPAIGRLFGSESGEATRSDVLLTITPRVVRGWDLAPKNVREFVSGTENNYMTEPLFASLAVSAKDGAKHSAGTAPIQTPSVTTTGDAGNTVTGKPTLGGTVTKGDLDSQSPTTQPSAPVTLPVFSFAEPNYEAVANQDLQVRLMAENLGNVKSIPIEILFNPQQIKYSGSQRGDLATGEYSAVADEQRGIIRVSLGYPEGSSANKSGVLATLSLKGIRPGISYLVYRSTSLTGLGGEAINVQVRASRIVIK